jgi:hypothetical protein
MISLLHRGEIDVDLEKRRYGTIASNMSINQPGMLHPFGSFFLGPLNLPFSHPFLIPLPKLPQ